MKDESFSAARRSCCLFRAEAVARCVSSLLCAEEAVLSTNICPFNQPAGKLSCNGSTRALEVTSGDDLSHHKITEKAAEIFGYFLGSEKLAELPVSLVIGIEVSIEEIPFRLRQIGVGITVEIAAQQINDVSIVRESPIFQPGPLFGKKLA